MIDYETTPHYSVLTNELEYRLICIPCFVELQPVHIGVWRCPICGRVGQPEHEKPQHFGVLATDRADYAEPIQALRDRNGGDVFQTGIDQEPFA